VASGSKRRSTTSRRLADVEAALAALDAVVHAVLDRDRDR